MSEETEPPIDPPPEPEVSFYTGQLGQLIIYLEEARNLARAAYDASQEASLAREAIAIAQTATETARLAAETALTRVETLEGQAEVWRNETAQNVAIIEAETRRLPTPLLEDTGKAPIIVLNAEGNPIYALAGPYAQLPEIGDAIVAHTAASDPHGQYTTEAEANVIAAESVQTHTQAGNPHPQYAPLSAITDSLAGHLATADPHPQYATDSDLSAHVAASDPHPLYTTQSEVQALIAGASTSGLTGAQVDARIATHAADSSAHAGLISAHTAAPDPHPQYATDANLAAHTSASDPHTQYLDVARADARFIAGGSALARAPLAEGYLLGPPALPSAEMLAAGGRGLRRDTRGGIDTGIYLEDPGDGTLQLGFSPPLATGFSADSEIDSLHALVVDGPNGRNVRRRSLQETAGLANLEFYSAGYQFFEDFINGVTGSALASSISGTGAAVSASIIDTSTYGAVNASTGTTATGRAGALNSNHLFLRGIWRFIARLWITTLSTSTERYWMRIGFMDSVTAEPNNGAYFEYDEIITPNWRFVTANGGSRSKTTSTIAVAASSWMKPRILYNQPANTLTFALAPNTTGHTVAATAIAPSASMGLGFAIFKTAGLTARTISLDYIGAVGQLTDFTR